MQQLLTRTPAIQAVPNQPTIYLGTAIPRKDLQMRYPNADKALSIHSTPDQKMAAVLETFELDSLDDLHPNAAEVIRRRIVMLDDDSLTAVLMAVNSAKVKFAEATP